MHHTFALEKTMTSYVTSGGVGGAWHVSGVHETLEAAQHACPPGHSVREVGEEEAVHAREAMRPRVYAEAGAAYPSGGCGNRGTIGA